MNNVDTFGFPKPSFRQALTFDDIEKPTHRPHNYLILRFLFFFLVCDLHISLVSSPLPVLCWYKSSELLG